MLNVYHNPRCRKSREVLSFLEQNGIRFTTYEYLKNGLSKEIVEGIFSKTNHNVKEFIRRNEANYKENFSTGLTSKDEMVQALVQFPKLLQRPVVETENNAWIVRDEDSKELLKNQIANTN